MIVSCSIIKLNCFWKHDQWWILRGQFYSCVDTINEKLLGEEGSFVYLLKNTLWVLIEERFKNVTKRSEECCHISVR